MIPGDFSSPGIGIFCCLFDSPHRREVAQREETEIPDAAV